MMNWTDIHPAERARFALCCGQLPQVQERTWQYHGRDYRVTCPGCQRRLMVQYVSDASFARDRWQAALPVEVEA